MKNLNRILLAIDSSENSLRAARFTGDLARSTGASITVITVHNDELLQMHLTGVAGWPGPIPNTSVSIEELKASIERSGDTEVIKPAVREIGEIKSEIKTIQLWGHAGETICDRAEALNSDLIIIGSRGRSSFAKLLLGSVTLQVLNHAPCPVTVVR